MANETQQKLKRKREEVHGETDTGIRTQAPSQALNQHGSSSHSYPVINLAGNAQAILGDVHGLDSKFFHGLGHTDAKGIALKALYSRACDPGRSRSMLEQGRRNMSSGSGPPIFQPGSKALRVFTGSLGAPAQENRPS